MRGGKHERALETKPQKQNNPHVPPQNLDLGRTMLSQTYLHELQIQPVILNAWWGGGGDPLYLQETVTASLLLRWGGVTLAFVVY